MELVQLQLLAQRSTNCVANCGTEGSVRQYLSSLGRLQLLGVMVDLEKHSPETSLLFVSI